MVSAKKHGLFYMHTLDGRPAEYAKGGQIVFASRAVKLVPTLNQIKRERTASEKWRRKEGLSGGVFYEHGHVSVRLPSGDTGRD